MAIYQKWPTGGSAIRRPIFFSAADLSMVGLGGERTGACSRTTAAGRGNFTLMGRFILSAQSLDRYHCILFCIS